MKTKTNAEVIPLHYYRVKNKHKQKSLKQYFETRAPREAFVNKGCGNRKT